jgi:hypothetical protein
MHKDRARAAEGGRDGDTLVYEQPETPLAGGFVTIR